MQSQIIKMIAAYKNINVSDIAKALNKSTSNFYQMLKRDNFRESELQEIAAVLGCNLEIKFIDQETKKEF